jgi:hypothetical protein
MTDWGSPESLRESTEYREKWKNEGDQDRVAEYRRWRRQFGHGAYVTDIDQVEYRRDQEGGLHPVATLELTRVEVGKTVGPGYLDSILDRYNKRDDQGTTARLWAWHLGVCVYIVLFREDLSEFWVYNLTNDKGWREMHQAQYKAWLIAFRSPA